MSDALEARFLAELEEELAHDRLLLPTLPEVALRVRDTIDDESATLDSIARIIATDAALSARIVQVANSPLMGGGRPVDSIQAALSRLGVRLVRDMVVSMVMQQMFQATSDAIDSRLRALWEHSTQVASISYALASQFTRLDPQQAMLAGLIHDIGALPVLAKAEDFPEILEDEAALEQVVRVLHPRLGRAILERWNFPPELVAVAAEHEELGRDSGETDYVDVVIVANLQSRLGSDHPLTRADWSHIPAFEKLGLAFDVNVVEMDETADEIEEAKSLLNY